MYCYRLGIYGAGREGTFLAYVANSHKTTHLSYQLSVFSYILGRNTTAIGLRLGGASQSPTIPLITFHC